LIIWKGSSVPRRRHTLPTALAALLAVGVVAVTALAPAAAAPAPAPAPTPTLAPITVPGGLQPGEATAVAGDCELAQVTCKPARAGSCSGNTSQTVAPATIRVLVRTGATTVAIHGPVPFEQYVEDVLPNEWISSWDGDALKAGAVAVKSYAWYWATHFGGYLNSDPAQCFDVTDDQDFQVYRAGSAVARTTSAVQQTWPFVARVGGRVLQTFYRSFLNNQTEGCGAFANGTTMSQWGTQNCVEASTANKYNVILGKYYFPGLQLTTARQQRTPHDFTFLQKSTPATFRAGHWSIADGYTPPTAFTFGYSGDIPTVIDSGDGFARVGVFHPATGTWYLGTATGGVASKIAYGGASDVPVPAHYSGVSKATVIAIFRPADGTWHRRGLAGVQYGQKGDIPVPGHYAGTAANDFADQIALFRPSSGRWYRLGLTSVGYGQKGDIPAPADYDGNGTTDIALYRPSMHTFYVRGHASVHYGVTGDVPVTGDFNGDGRADFAVYRPSTHTLWIRGLAQVSVGAAGDTPVGKAPYRG
jgi:hypothetical protein